MRGKKRLPNEPALPGDVLDGLLSDNPNETSWAEHVVRVSKSIVPSAVGASFHILEFDRHNRAKRRRIAVPEEYAGPADHAVAERVPRCAPGLVVDGESSGRTGDAKMWLTAHPADNVATTVTWYFDTPPVIGRHERQLISRLALHLDAAHRLRQRPDAVRAVLSDRGRILHKKPDAPDLWPALLDGRVSIVPRHDGARAQYLVVENAPETRSTRALTLAETATLRLASQGMSNKMMAYGLGISSTAVSRHLATAAAKLGFTSRPELIRMAALLVQDTRDGAPELVLTEAERAILTLLQRGLSNLEIARLRSRSVRTIANQVASLLRKTGSTSRRQLTVRRSAATESERTE